MNAHVHTLHDLAVRMAPTPWSVRPGVENTYYNGPLPSPGALAAYRVGDRLPGPLTDVGVLGSDIAGGVGTEAFRIEITDGAISVAASDDVGRFYAVGALRQLVTIAGNGRSEEDVRLPTGSLVDRPELGDRGFMLDVSRNRVPTRETLGELLDLLALVRYNHLELYFEHVFAYRDHGEVWRDTGIVTAEDIQWLDDECAARGIELVPNQNSFGHLAGWLGRERYRYLAEAPDGFSDPWGNHYDHPFSLCPAEPAVPAFLAGLYDELLPNFRSRRFNVGLDETFDLGQGRSAGRIADLATAERSAHPEIDEETARRRATGRVYLEMLKVVHALVSERGRRMYFWGDIIQNHPELVAELPDDVVAVEWGYEADHDFDTRCGRLRESGVPFLVAPGTSTWNSAGGRFDTARVNIRSAVEAAHRYGGRGVLMTDWGDNGDLAPATAALPALVLAGCLSWNPRGAATRETPVSAGKATYVEPDPFAWLRLHIFDDASGTLTEALRLLNTLDEPNGAQRIHNASILAVALLTFDLPSYGSVQADFDPAVIDAIEGRAKKARSLLTGDRAGDAETSDTDSTAHYRRELLFACDLALYAVEILRIRHDGSSVDGSTLAPLTNELDERFSQLWLARYRPGGLDDSRRWLRKAARELGLPSEGDA